MMLWKLEIKPKALKQLRSLNPKDRIRITKKLEYYASTTTPHMYAEVLVDFEHGSYRFRIGNYRVIVDFDDWGKLIIVAIIGHRKNIYRKP